MVLKIFRKHVKKTVCVYSCFITYKLLQEHFINDVKIDKTLLHEIFELIT